MVEAPGTSVHVAPLGMPMPTPIGIVAGGPAAVSVTLTSPARDALNVWKSLPATATVPLNVSVTVVDGAVVDGLLPQPASGTSSARATPMATSVL
jgi:hypothetical protein